MILNPIVHYVSAEDDLQAPCLLGARGQWPTGQRFLLHGTDRPALDKAVRGLRKELKARSYGVETSWEKYSCGPSDRPVPCYAATLLIRSRLTEVS